MIGVTIQPNTENVVWNQTGAATFVLYSDGLPNHLFLGTYPDLMWA